MSTTVQDVLKRKAPEVFTTSPGATVYDAVALMARHEIGALVVLHDDKVAGIVTERDYARKIILKGRDSRETPVGDIMTRKVVCVAAGQSVDDCMALMTSERFRHLPVLDGTRLIGILSIGDVVKAVLAEKEVVIGELERYIAGG